MKNYTIIWYFDVWWSEDEGWWVNDQTIIQHKMDIPDDITPKHLLELIHNITLRDIIGREYRAINSTDLRHYKVEDYGEGWEIYETDKERHEPRPVIGIKLNY
jgi:hypothetical protein